MSYMLQGPSLRARQNQRVAQELQALATQLHQNVDIRDRKYHLKNYKSCFVGSVRFAPRSCVAACVGRRVLTMEAWCVCSATAGCCHLDGGVRMGNEPC